MRDKTPFVPVHLGNLADPLVVPVVATDQFQVGGGKRLPGQSLALFGAFVDVELELGEHGLPEQSRAQAF